jgi:hypothetical protein
MLFDGGGFGAPAVVVNEVEHVMVGTRKGRLGMHYAIDKYKSVRRSLGAAFIGVLR